MVDIHCHILPEIDDGAQNLEESIQMAKAAVQEGITKVVASPHHYTSRFHNPKEEIVPKVALLNKELQNRNIPLEILVGQEVRINGDWISEYENNQIATINDNIYVLIEFPANHVPRYAEQLFYGIQMTGLIPIIVHPERNSQIVEQPEKLYRLIEKGAISQITAASVAGYFGKSIQKFSLQLIEANLTHVVASDAHNTTNRSFKMIEAFDVIEREFGSDAVYMFNENAELIVSGNMIYRDNPKNIKRRKLLGIF